MTLYVPTHRDGSTALPYDFRTEAVLWILCQSNPSDWRIEPILAPVTECDAQFLQQIQQN